MGADSSKEESRSNSPEQSRKRNQYVRQQKRPEPAYQASQATYQYSPPQAPVERSRAPYSYTTEHLQNQASPNVVERPRAPYNYSSDQLQHGSYQSPNLYPNLNVQEGYVYVQRSSPQPSAPPASQINELPKVPPRPAMRQANTVPEIPPTSRPISSEISACKESPNDTAKLTQPSITSPNAPGPSQFANSSANKNRPRSAARNRNSNDSYSCPTCGQRLGITIYQCLGGHSCCKDCRLAGRTCGNCHSAITDMRNITLEAFIAEVKNSCQNPGCTLSFNTYDMELHQKECPFGEMDCPMGSIFGQCSTRCKVADMAAHFDACHKEQRTAEIDKEMYVFNICMETHKLFLIKNGPFTFLVHVKVNEKERNISMTVQLLGTKISANKWSYEFHVYNKRQPLRKYLYVDSCQSISTPVDDIFKESKCATLPLTYAMTFVNESALTYKFFIKKEVNQQRRPRNNAAK